MDGPFSSHGRPRVRLKYISRQMFVLSVVMYMIWGSQEKLKNEVLFYKHLIICGHLLFHVI